jgi:hypothetical protein
MKKMKNLLGIFYISSLFYFFNFNLNFKHIPDLYKTNIFKQKNNKWET